MEVDRRILVTPVKEERPPAFLEHEASDVGPRSSIKRISIEAELDTERRHIRRGNMAEDLGENAVLPALGILPLGELP